jgi:hypothetical protein
LTVEWLKYTKGLDLIVKVKTITTSPTSKRPREPPSSADIKNLADSTPNSPQHKRERPSRTTTLLGQHEAKKETYKRMAQYDAALLNR